MLKARIAVTL